MKKLLIAALALGAALVTTTPALACSGCHVADYTAKVGPHQQFLEASTFPAVAVVEFRTDPANGVNKTMIAAEQLAAVMATLGVEVLSVLPRIPLMTVRVPSKATMLNLLARGEVLSVRPDDDVLLDTLLDPGAGVLTKIPQLLNVNSYRGEGISVAIIDTGIATHKVASGGKSTYRTESSYSVIARVDWTGITPWYAPNYQTGMKHGTHVAEIIHTIVPDAKLLDLRVADTNQAPTVSSIAKAVNWIIDNRELYNIRVANISMSAGTRYPGTCDTGLAHLVRDLTEFGVTVVVSSGNDSDSNGVPEPACSSHAIAVGGQWDYAWTGAALTVAAGDPWGQGNFGQAVDVVAPACSITVSDYVSASQTFSVCGTSVAAPYVTGVVASILGANGVSATPATMRAVIAYGTNTWVSVAGRSYPALDAMAALNLARDYLLPHDPALEPLPFPPTTNTFKGSTSLCSTTVCNWAPQ